MDRRADAALLPAWTLVLGLGGRRHFAAERVRVQEDDAAALAGEAGLRLSDEPPGAAAVDVAAAWAGSRLSRPGSCGAPGGSVERLLPLHAGPGAAGSLALATRRGGGPRLPAADLGVYIQPQHQGVSHHVEFSLPYDPADAG